MLVFIDDSGDAGFKLEKGSSRFFVISLIIFDDELEAEKTAVAIKELKRAIKFPDDVEFKFFKSRNEIKSKFLMAVRNFNFKVRCLVVDKTKIYSSELKGNRSKFYSYAIKTVLKYSENIIEAKIKIDGSGDRVFRRSFLGYLKKQLNNEQKKVVRNCKLVDSKENVLIQLADMVSGSIRRSYDFDKADRLVYRDIIKKRIDDIWEFK
jgi:Protein of unknown function (DUF3800)